MELRLRFADFNFFPIQILFEKVVQQLLLGKLHSLRIQKCELNYVFLIVSL